MLSTFQIVLLSLLQGITEFLPVSSSGHLILFSIFTTFPDQGQAMDVAMHIGSIIAVMIYFSEELWKMFKGLIKSWFLPNFKDYGNRVFWLVIIASIPAMIFGLFLRTEGVEWMRSSKLIGWTILGYGILLYIADKVGLTVRKVEHLGILDAILIGLAQCLALIPGTSRSGITITMARFLGMERREAAKFSMLLSIPTILGAGMLVGYELFKQNNLTAIIFAIDGILYSFIFSVIAIYTVMWWLRKSTFLPFVIYRVVIGTILLLNAYGYINITQ